MSQALYRTYRSQSLDEVIGQRHVTDILDSAIKHGRVSHAYLFTGPKGVGKTSVARIFARSINGVSPEDSANHLDIIEIDAASNNGVDDVRELRERVQLAPVSGKYKVYIIDEVHMLSKPAFNALLKTLEEPPAHVVFILATTDVDKVPATIVSRTQRFGFRAINEEDAVAHLKTIAKKEKIAIEDDALRLIVKRGQGSFRDSISLLDQLSSLVSGSEKITAALVEASLGLAPESLVSDLLEATAGGDVKTVAELLHSARAEGLSATILTQQLIEAIQEDISAKPSLLPLLDALLDVPRSTQPDMKLLVTLGKTAAAHAKPKSAALAAPVLEVTATIAELSKKATQKRPKDTKTSVSPHRSNSASDTSLPPNQDNRDIDVSLPPQTSETEVEDSKRISDITSIDWPGLIEYTRTHAVALYSVLSKCTYELSDTTLTIYCGNAFYKKKIDDPKYSPHLYEALQAIRANHLEIVTLSKTAPPKSSQAAKIAAIMGGGEEVTIASE